VDAWTSEASEVGKNGTAELVFLSHAPFPFESGPLKNYGCTFYQQSLHDTSYLSRGLSTRSGHPVPSAGSLGAGAPCLFDQRSTGKLGASWTYAQPSLPMAFPCWLIALAVSLNEITFLLIVFSELLPRNLFIILHLPNISPTPNSVSSRSFSHNPIIVRLHQLISTTF
jgi:hypothetical protein